MKVCGGFDKNDALIIDLPFLIDGIVTISFKSGSDSGSFGCNQIWMGELITKMRNFIILKESELVQLSATSNCAFHQRCCFCIFLMAHPPKITKNKQLVM